tara:strand:+ start:44 stop:565 length:522 start_codon:yes stop_codon:yes gene_type:complete
MGRGYGYSRYSGQLTRQGAADLAKRTAAELSSYKAQSAKDAQAAIDAATKQQQSYQQQLQATASRTQSDIAKQLQIVQSEKSAVSKMTQEYTAMLQEEADRRVKAEEKARVSAATSAANQSRQGQTANLQIQPASSTPQTAGTQSFKRRKDQFKITKPAYSGLSISQSGMVNV